MRPIYLDYNATTPIAPRVQEAMLPFLAEHYALPSGIGPAADAVRQAIEDARFRVRTALGATDEHRIVFTSGGAESCQLAIRGVVGNWRRCEYQPTCHVVISGVEHACVADLATYLCEWDRVELTSVPCGEDGRVQPESIADAIRADTALVCVAHADSLTGVVQPIAAIADACHRNKTLLHVDAAASFGKIATNVEQLGADLLSISAHKAYGPKGVGALYVRDSAVLEPVLIGQGLEGDPLRGGTPNVPGIIGLGHCAELATASLEESQPRLQYLRDDLESQIANELGDALTLWGQGSPRLPNTSLMTLAGCDAHEVAQAAPELILPFLAGSPAARHATTRDRESWRQMLRVSIGWYTTKEEIDRAASLLLDAWERVRGD